MNDKLQVAPEIDRDALLVRAAVDIMFFQSRVAKLELQLKEAYRLASTMQRAAKGKSVDPDNMVSLERVVSMHISLTYQACEKDIARTAKVLGVSRPTVYKYLPEDVARQRRERASHRDTSQVARK